MTSTLDVVGLVLAPPLGWLLGAWLAGRSESRQMSVVEEPHLAEWRFLAEPTQTGIRCDESIDHADDCRGPGRRSSRTGIGPAARRALGPGQRQLGPTSRHQPDHAALTRQTSTMAEGGLSACLTSAPGRTLRPDGTHAGSMGPPRGGYPRRNAFHFGPDLAPRTVCAPRGTVKINRTSRAAHRATQPRFQAREREASPACPYQRLHVEFGAIDASLIDFMPSRLPCAHRAVTRQPRDRASPSVSIATWNRCASSQAGEGAFFPRTPSGRVQSSSRLSPR